uniref:Uncharacterized protein n=1 Tax=Globodera rostochiensis TaxID=31243 RepID=A0A914HGJ7_GLORO
MRPLQNAILLTCFFFVALLPCHCNGLTCGAGMRMNQRVHINSTVEECSDQHITCFLLNCTAGLKIRNNTDKYRLRFVQWNCSESTASDDGGKCNEAGLELALEKQEPAKNTTPWTCQCTFGPFNQSLDLTPAGMGPNRGGRLFVKTHYLLFALQMIIGFVPAMFVGLSGRTA